MGRVNLKPEDHLAAVIVPSQWYPLKVSQYEELPSNDGNSINHWLYFTITAGKFVGKVIRQSFNEKFIAPIIPVFQAAGAGLNPKAAVSVDPASLVNKTLDGYVEVGKNVTSGGNFNKLSDWAPYGSRSKKVIEEQAAAPEEAKA